MNDNEDKVINKGSEVGQSFSDLMKKVVEKELEEEKNDGDDLIETGEEVITADEPAADNLKTLEVIMKAAEEPAIKEAEIPVFEWKEEQKPVVESYQAVSEVGIINSSTTINETVSSKGHIRVEGSVIGDIFAYGDVKVNGKIAGDVEAANVELDDCVIEGDIKARGDVNIGKGSTLSGNLNGQLVTIDGKVKGDISASKGAHMSATSLVKGSLSSPTLSMSAGAELQGKVNVSKEEI